MLDNGRKKEFLARSPDLTPMDFFVSWGYLRDKVYPAKPGKVDELKKKIEKTTSRNSKRNDL